MNRRSFIRSLPVGGLYVAFSNSALSAVLPQRVTPIDLSRFKTPYTEAVGIALLRDVRYAANIAQLDTQLRASYELGDTALQHTLLHSIEAECQAGQFWEVEGWVITPSEALLSALIMQGSV